MTQRISTARLRYILSYVAACALPIIVCAAIILGNNYVEERNQRNQNAINALSLVKTQLDLEFKNLESASMHFASNIAALTETANAGGQAISAQLARYKTSYPFISEAVYMPRGSVYIYDTQEIKPYNSFRDMLIEQANLDYSAFYSSMATLSHVRLRATHLYTTLQMDGGYALYMQPVPHLDTTPEGSIAFFINCDTIGDIFLDCLGDIGGYYYVLDQNMTAVYTSHDNEISDALLTQMKRLRGTGLFHGSADDADYVMLRAISDTLGAYYMLAFPAELFYGEVYLSIREQGWLFFLALLLIVAIAILLSSIFYSPIEQLARHIRPGSEKEKRSHGDILRDVGLRYQQMSDEYRLLNIKVDQQRDMLLRQLINSLLQGHASEAAVSSILQSIPLEWQGNCFLAMHIWLEPPGKPVPTTVEWPLPAGTAYLTMMEGGSQYAVLADVRVQNEEDGEALRLSCGQTCQERFQELGLSPLLVSVGGLCRDAMGLPFSYMEALSNGRLLGDEECQQVMLFTPFSYKSLSQTFLPMAEKQLLCQCIESGNSDLAKRTLARLSEGLSAFSANRSLMRSIAFYLYDAVSTTVASLRLPLSKGKLDYQMASIVPARFLQALDEYVTEACDLIARRNAHSVQNTQSGILQYVHSHYTDYNLSIDQVCQRFELTESYLSRFFRQETGYSFSQYVTMLRMNRVKRLLETTDTPIKDIVQSVGYADAANFTRKFRQQEGMTPSEYRMQALRTDK